MRPSSLQSAVALCSAIAMLSGTPVSGVAQSGKPASAARAAVDSRWTPWVGCWASDSTHAPAEVLCVVPASKSTVNLVTLANGRVSSSEPVDATGRPTPVAEDGCTGSRTVVWSANRHQAFLNSKYECPNLAAASTRVLAIGRDGQLVDVEQVRAGGGSIQQARRWRAVDAASAVVPRDIAAAVGQRTITVAAARAAAAAPLSVSDVTEALRSLDPAVVREWIAASGQRFRFDSAETATLVAASVPPGVVQAMMGADASAQQGFSSDVTRSSTVGSGGYASGEYLVGSEPGAAGIVYSNGGQAMYDYGYGYGGYPVYAPLGYPAYGYGALAPYYAVPAVVVVGGHHDFERPHPAEPPRGPAGIPRSSGGRHP